MDHIQRIIIKRFKNLDHASFSLDRINTIVGANNSGKSSILQAIHFATSSVQSVELDRGLSPSNEGKWLTIDPSRLIYVPAEDVHALGSGGRLWENKDEAVSITLVLNSGDELSVSMRKGRNRNILFSISDIDVARQISAIDDPFTIFTPGLAGIAKSEQYVSDGVLLRVIARGDSNLVLRNTLLRLWDSKDKDDRWFNFINDLQQLFPDHDIIVEFAQATDEDIQVLVEAGSEKIPLELCGTGVLQTIQILSYIHCFSPNVIILDEPDSHLHPNNQRLLCRMFTSIALDRDIQVILCTHSRHMLDALQGSAKYLWARDGSVDISEDETNLSILLDLGALDIKERLSLGKANNIVLTEDDKITNLRIIFNSSGFNDDDTDYISYYGCTTPHNLRPLLKVIRETNPKTQVFVHVDRDYHTEDEVKKWKQKIRALHAEPFVTIGVDTESHFLNALHISALNEELSPEEAESLIEEALNETQTDSIQHSINGRVDIERKQKSFGNLNIGELSTTMNTAYEKDNFRFAHGKTVLAKTKNLFQDTYKKNLIIYQPTKHLAVEELEDMKL